MRMRQTMKRKVFSLILIAVLSAGLLVGCKKPSELIVDLKEQAEETEEDLSSAEMRASERMHTPIDYTSPSFLPEGQQSFMDEQGLIITTGDSFNMKVLDHSTGQMTEIPCTYVIYETTDGCEDGQKRVVMLCNIPGTLSLEYWTSYFDRYTGISFETEQSSNSLFDGCNFVNENDLTLELGEYSYDIHTVHTTTLEEGLISEKVEIYCPIEYDGAVIQYGYPVEIDTYYDYPFGSEGFTIDQTPWCGNEYFNYFAIEYLPIQAK